ncbi:Type II secretion system (T2SS), protein F (plasmid) [Carboxydocella thermautotrophica]|nr:Type II secretion system (T2SS), protein F [Carboxydocella thermautotrophica]
MFYNLMLFTGLLILATSILSLLLKPPSNHALRQIQLVQNIGRTKAERELEELPLLIRLVAPLYVFIVSKVSLKEGSRRKLELLLEQADLRLIPNQVMTPVQFIAIKYLAVLAIGGFFGFLYLLRPTNTTFITFILALFIAYFSPGEIVKARAKSRQLLMSAELPDFIDAIRTYLSAGLTLRQAVTQIIPITGPGLRENVQKLKTDLEVFNDEIKALRRFADRCGLADVKYIVTMLEQGIKSGIDFKQIFITQSALLRERTKNTLKREIKKRPVYLALVGVMLFINILLILGTPPLYAMFAVRGGFLK